MTDAYDVLIIGSGLAGLTAAVRLHQAGRSCLVVTKESEGTESNTLHAQGGIIARREGDDPRLLAEDIMKAGGNYGSRPAVEQLAEEGPKLVFDFLADEVGIAFSTDAQGDLSYTGEAAHSIRRILHYQDRTGERIETALWDYAQRLGVEILTDHTAVDLITNYHHSTDVQEIYAPREVMGAYVLNNRTGEVHCICAGRVILASGGLGNLYQHTTNPAGAAGDGISMASHAGADIINAEFVQFHPTALYHRDIKRFLISESLRGEGARITDLRGREFMREYSPQGDLAPRDVTARALFDRMSRDGTEYMLLNLADHYRGTEPISERFHRIYEVCRSGGIDITREPIPVVPAAHYFCGGVKVDLQGRSSVKGLYAVGEVSCTGVHGANRLASASLLEALLWGWKAAEAISMHELTPEKLRRFGHIPDWTFPRVQEQFDPLLIKQDWKAIQLTLWNYVGIIRTKKGLQRAQADLDYYAHRIIQFYREAQLNRDIIELRHAVTAARIITSAALRNPRSIGCHCLG